MDRKEPTENPAELRLEKHNLLVGLKTTVEGLLATNTHNVWNTFGGLDRVCNHVEKILCHRLKPPPFTYSAEGDFWPFIQALKWISPVTAPTIEHFSRQAASSGDLSGRGRAWLRDSLHTHCLSSYLELLSRDGEHLLEHYYEDAFLCSPEYREALLLCLKAIEHNTVTLLTDINPALLSTLQRRGKKQANHSRSASLPINQVASTEKNSGLRWSLQSSTSPSSSFPFASPGKEIALCSSGEQVFPFASATSPDESRLSALESLKSVLQKSGSDASGEYEASGEQEETSLLSFNSFDHTYSDPLLNMEFPASAFGTDTPSSVASSKSNEASGVVPVDSAQVKGISRCCSLGSGLGLHTADASNNSSAERPGSDSPSLGQSFLSDDSGLSMEKPTLLLSPSKGAHKRSRSDGAGAVVHSEKFDSASVGTLNSDHSGNQSDSTLVGSSYNGQYATFPGRLTRKGVGLLHPPAQGQSLLSYLSSQDFGTCANLDRENAHFYISETLISALEQMKWNRFITPKKTSESEEESDEEINRLKQRIRIRRRERLRQKARFPHYDDKSETTSTSFSASPRSSPHPTSSSSSTSHASDCESSDGVDDHEIELTLSDKEMEEREGDLTKMKNSGLSLSMASLYSDAELQKAKSAIERLHSMQESNGSAESVAISLLKKFSEKQLPKASELVWLVSEDDAPQALLPLPNSFPVSPDDSSMLDASTEGHFTTRIRGNLEWAPPRLQIIFNIQPYVKKSEAIKNQNYRCAGCGVKVEQGYIKRFRLCDYLGKYFCQCCHSNATDYIPALVLHNWDFSQHYVSNFSREILATIHSQPHFNVEVVNPRLYRKVKSLAQIRDFRFQLKHLRNFFVLCHKGEKFLKMIGSFPTHWAEDPHLYSMADFLQVKNGTMLTTLKEAVRECLTHVESCTFCQGLGFVCEMCRSPEIIFPFQLTKVQQCPECRTCFHKKCFVPDKCPKCFRLEARRQRLAQESTESEESDEKTSEKENTPVKRLLETPTPSVQPNT